MYIGKYILQWRKHCTGLVRSQMIMDFRAGGAPAAANARVEDWLLKRYGWWKSENAKDGYIQDSCDSRLSAKLGVLLPGSSNPIKRNVSIMHALATRFYLTEEQTLVLAVIPELLLWVIFLCVPHAVYLSAIIASENELYLALYSVCILCFSIHIVCIV